MNKGQKRKTQLISNFFPKVKKGDQTTYEEVIVPVFKEKENEGDFYEQCLSE